jgi:uncharacterized protein YjbI with pentapeptide repeats
MDVADLLKEYSAGRRDFQEVNLRYQNLRGKNLSDADFSGTDFTEAKIEGTNFTDCIFTGSVFKNAKAGQGIQAKIILSIFSFFLSILSGLISVFASAFVENTLHCLLFIILMFGLIKAIQTSTQTVLLLLTLSIIVLCSVVLFELLRNITLTPLNTFSIFIMVIFTILSIAAGSISISVAVVTYQKLALIVVQLVFIVTVFFVIWKSPNYDNLVNNIAISSSILIINYYIGERVLNEAQDYLWLRQLSISFAVRGGTNFRKAQLKNTDFTGAILINTDLRNAKLIHTNFHSTKKLEFAKTDNTILTDLKVRELLVNRKGTNRDYKKCDFSKANLTEVFLNNADLTNADLTDATLKNACLEGANLTLVQAIGTDFTGVKITSATLEDWKINGNTIFENIICDYFYLKKDKQERYSIDVKKNLSHEEFTRFFIKDFLNPIQNENINKVKFQTDLEQKFKTKVKAIEKEHQVELNNKDQSIRQIEKEKACLRQLCELLILNKGDTIINNNKNAVEVNAMTQSESKGNTYHQNKIGINHISGGNNTIEEGIKVADIINEEGAQNIATVVGEIKQILEQLFENYPTHTMTEQMEVAKKAIESIENNPSLKYRVINVASKAGLAAIEKALDNPIGAFMTTAIKVWLETSTK